MALFQKEKISLWNKATRICSFPSLTVQSPIQLYSREGNRREFKMQLTPISIRRLTVKNGKEIYNINNRSFKYGFTTATKIESTEKVSNYITKYITKELITMSKRQHRYLYSKNLAKPQSETLFEEDLKFMELLLSKHKDLVKIKKVKDEERGIETTYITIKKTE